MPENWLFKHMLTTAKAKEEVGEVKEAARGGERRFRECNQQSDIEKCQFIIIEPKHTIGPFRVRR